MYKILVTEKVITYFDNLYDYLKTNNINVEYINKVKKKFYESEKNLKEFPYICQKNKDGFYILIIDKKHKFIYEIIEEEKIVRIFSAYNVKQNIFVRRDY